MGNLRGNFVLEQNHPVNELLAMASRKEDGSFSKKDEETINKSLSPVADDSNCFTQLTGSVLAVPLHTLKGNPLAVDLSVKKTNPDLNAQMVSHS